MIRLLDIPGVPELDARLELVPEATATSDPVTRQRLEQIVGFLGLRLGFWGGIDAPDVANDDWLIDCHSEARLVVWWRKRGWDVTRDDGSVCRCYNALRPALAYIEQGCGGSSKVQVEAAIWKVQRAAQQGPDPKQRRQDEAFLALGGRGRRSRIA